MTFEDRLRLIIGSLTFQNAGLEFKVEQLEAKIKELEKPPEPKKK